MLQADLALNQPWRLGTVGCMQGCSTLVLVNCLLQQCDVMETGWLNAQDCISWVHQWDCTMW